VSLITNYQYSDKREWSPTRAVTAWADLGATAGPRHRSRGPVASWLVGLRLGRIVWGRAGALPRLRKDGGPRGCRPPVRSGYASAHL